LSESSEINSNEPADLPKPIIRRMRWPFPLIWIVPILAAGLAGYYVYLHLQQRGPLIVLKFDDVTGIQSGQTPIKHLGVDIGQVESMGLTPDYRQALLYVRLHRPAEQFARQGAQFWIVRPQISMASVTGLNTVISGPYIEGTPGQGERATEFLGLPRAPIAGVPGLHITLYGEHPEHLDVSAPVYFRGIQVGQIEGISLTIDSRRVAVRAFIYNRYAPLVRPDSKFWIVSGADVKGGLFTGVEVKLDSLRSFVAGGIAFATPNDKQGQPTSGPAADGTEFELFDEAKKEWLSWSPRISLAPE
jgi:paraquat-inducible protein B